MPAGRPLAIPTPEEFERRAEEYFRKCDENSKGYTYTGLCLGVGLSSRQSLDRYGQREEFSDCVKRAKTKVEEAYEDGLRERTPAGSIFALKNFGWRDRQELDHAGEVKITVDVKRPDGDQAPS